MVENQLSRYGAISKVIPNVGPQGKVFIVAPTSKAYFGDLGNTFPADTDGAERLFSTVQGAVNAVSSGRGDAVIVCPGSYDEAVTVTKSSFSIVGLGGRGNAGIAPSATNGVALTIDGTAARTSDVTLVNVGCEGNGTGGGLYVFGNIRRIRVEGCKLEGGAFGAKFESTAAGSVADTRITDSELAWTTTGIHITVTGGGDPVTQTYIAGNHFHDTADQAILSDLVHTAALWIYDNKFSGNEDGTEPANDYVEASVADSTGEVAGNYVNAANAASAWNLATGIKAIGNHYIE